MPIPQLRPAVTSAVAPLTSIAGGFRWAFITVPFLLTPLQMQISTSIANGFALGSINAVLCCAYAAAFFYGVYAVFDFGRSGGRVLTAVFAALIGGFSLGLVGDYRQRRCLLRGFRFACIVYGLF